MPPGGVLLPRVEAGLTLPGRRGVEAQGVPLARPRGARLHDGFGNGPRDPRDPQAV